MNETQDFASLRAGDYLPVPAYLFLVLGYAAHQFGEIKAGLGAVIDNGALGGQEAFDHFEQILQRHLFGIRSTPCSSA